MQPLCSVLSVTERPAFTVPNNRCNYGFAHFSVCTFRREGAERYKK
jgi:hypothetical protein